MVTMILISTVAILVALVGCAAIWGGDVRRSRELGSADLIRQRTEPRLAPAPLSTTLPSTPLPLSPFPTTAVETTDVPPLRAPLPGPGTPPAA